MGTLASGAKVVSRIACYAGWVLPINMQLLVGITYCVQSILPGAVGMQRKASIVYNPQISIYCSLLLKCSYFTMRQICPAGAPVWDSDGEETGKMPHWAGKEGGEGRRGPVNLEGWPRILGTGHSKAVSLSNKKA